MKFAIAVCALLIVAAHTIAAAPVDSAAPEPSLKLVAEPQVTATVATLKDLCANKEP